MLSRRIVIACACAVALAGCETVHDARSAQRATLAAHESPAPDPESRLAQLEWTLPALVDFALTNRPAMVIRRLAVDDAHLALKTIAADAPLVSATPWNAVDASASFGHSESSRGAHRRLHGRTDGNAAGALSLDILLYDFGRNRAEAEEQVENVLAAEQQLLDEGYAIFEEVSSAYFQLLRNGELLTVARAKVESCAARLKQAEDRLAAGEAQSLDVLRARLDWTQAKEAVVAAQNDVAVAQADLAASLGLASTAGAPLPGAADSSGPQEIFEPTTEGAADAYAFALTNTPTMAMARAKLRAASARVDYAIADLKPNVSASLSLRWADPLWYWNWGVNAVESVFTGWRKTTAVDRAVVQMATAAQGVDAAAQSLAHDIELAVAERDNAREARVTAESSVAQAKENFETVAEQYRQGEASRVDYTDAIAAYADAQGSRITAFYRGQIAESKLFRLTGRLPVWGNSADGEGENLARIPRAEGESRSDALAGVRRGDAEEAE